MFVNKEKELKDIYTTFIDNLKMRYKQKSTIASSIIEKINKILDTQHKAKILM